MCYQTLAKSAETWPVDELCVLHAGPSDAAPPRRPCYRLDSSVSTLDRYLIRQTLPPFLLSLGLFTFVLAIMPMLDNTRTLLAKGVPLPTVGILLLLLLPSALSLTIPMALLTRY